MKIKLTALKDVRVFASYGTIEPVRDRFGDILQTPVPRFGWLLLRRGESKDVVLVRGIDPGQLPGEPTTLAAPGKQVVAIDYSPHSEGVREFYGLLRAEQGES